MHKVVSILDLQANKINLNENIIAFLGNPSSI